MVRLILLLTVMVSTSQTWREEIARATKLLDQGSIEQALSPLMRAYAAEPSAPDVLWMLALVHRELERYEVGLPYVVAFVELEPDAVPGRLLLADYHNALTNYDRAIEEFKRVLMIEAGHPQALHGLAMLEMQLGRDGQAVVLLEQIVEVYPNDSRALVPLGILNFRSGRFEEAIRTLNKAVREEPESYDARHHLGALYSELGRYQLALVHLEKALSLKEDAGTLYELGLVYARKEELPEAKKYFQSSNELFSEHAETHFRLGEIYHYENAVVEAERFYKRAIELNDQYATAYFHLGRLYAETNRSLESITKLERSIEIDRTFGEAFHLLARLYEELDRKEEAKIHFEQSLTLAPFAPEPRLNYGNFLLRNGSVERGRSLLEQFQLLKRVEDRLKELKAAVNFDPTDSISKRALVEYLLKHDRKDEALAECLRFLALGTMEPIHHVLLASVYEARGNFNEARLVIDKAVGVMPGVRELVDYQQELGRRRR